MEFQVVGLKDERLGEQVCACIRLREGQQCTAEEIKAYCKGQVLALTYPAPPQAWSGSLMLPFHFSFCLFFPHP